MNKELKNVLSKTEPSNTNVVWYHPTEGGIIPKVFRGGWQALIQGAAGDNTQVIEWSHTHNMNDYKDAGTYRIKGERTGSPLSDNLPIMNSGSGHTIEGILYVLDSSLTNGSGKEDDCTITQFLMLSNRVGGQEGDMYMRSAYGANKDSLTWKPWEKYQTNMEVGAVSDMKLLNPNNPTEILKHNSGMNHIIDNGIYSGIYFGPKCMVGTGEDNWHISFQDATAIETFVMVVINNYAAASNARCITQVKFAVTNGGVFSMEKRSTTPGTTDDWSQWEAVGGGGGNRIKWNDGAEFTEVVNDRYGVTITMGSATIKRSITLAAQEGNVLAIGDMFGKNTVIDNTDDGIWLKKHGAGGDVTAVVDIKGYGELNLGSSVLMVGTGLDSAPGPHDVILGEEIYIGKNVSIGDDTKVSKSQISTTEPNYTINLFSNQQELVESKVTMGGAMISALCTEHLSNYDHATGLNLRSEGSTAYIGASDSRDFRDDTYSIKMNQMYITDTSFKVLHIEETQDSDVEIETTIAHGIAIAPSEDGSKLLLSYNGKSAELPLT